MKEKQLYLFNNAICSSYVHVFLLMDHCKMQQTNVHMSESQLQGDEMNGMYIILILLVLKPNNCRKVFFSSSNYLPEAF